MANCLKIRKQDKRCDDEVCKGIDHFQKDSRFRNAASYVRKSCGNVEMPKDLL